MELNAVKYTLIALAERLHLRIHADPSPRNQSTLNVTDHNTSCSQSQALLSSDDNDDMMKRLQQKLNACNDILEGTHGQHHVTTEALVGREIEFFRSTGTKGKLLTALHKALLSIPPSSVEAERAFSAAGLFLTKLRTRLTDNTLNNITILRHFFTNNNNFM